MNRALTETVRAEMLNFGMDLVGFGPVIRWEKAPYLMSPQAILPESKTVVVGAIHITDTWTEMGGEPEPQDGSPGGWQDQNGLLDRTAYRVVRLLNDHGHQAIAVASSNIWRYRAFEGIPSIFAPDLSHIHAATAAGLAEIGWSGLAITPEFGSRVRFISIVTDAELVPTPMYDGPKLCDMCGECIRFCPTAALRKDMNAKEPRVVEIGGKTFKYANKNIWRCAWGEHFNLDLNSDTLKKDRHVDETVIFEELQNRGVRGHERGVCQKVCVPPHLRTKKPSFGRDRMIAQNRINPRYPESMPTLRKMRDDLIARGIVLGFDLGAAAPLNPDSEAGRRALAEAPGVRTVLAFVMRVPPEAVAGELPQKSAEAYGYAASTKAHQALLRLARMVEDYGYSASSYTGDAVAHASAAMAELGVLEGGLLVTPEFGRNQVVGAIVTSAPIDASPRVRERREPPRALRLSGKKLRRDLETLAAGNLVTLFGVTPAERIDPVAAQLKEVVDEAQLGKRVVDANKKLWYHGAYIPEIIEEDIRIRKPSDYVAGAKSVIVMGMHYPGEVVRNAGLDTSKQVGCYNFHQYQTCFELRFAAFELAKRLDEMGYASMITENLLGVGSYTDSPRGALPDMRCNALEAVAAGLGEIGSSGALLTADHGPRQRVIALVTDAELEPDEPLAAAGVCAACSICAEACPTNALSGQRATLNIGGVPVAYPLIPRHRCDWAKRYSLVPEEGPALIGNNTHVEAPEGEITIEILAQACAGKDPILKCRTCILEPCLKRCPAGLRKA